MPPTPVVGLIYLNEESSGREGGEGGKEEGREGRMEESFAQIIISK